MQMKDRGCDAPEGAARLGVAGAIAGQDMDVRRIRAIGSFHARPN